MKHAVRSLAALVAVTVILSAATTVSVASRSDLERDVAYLSSEELGGRLTGTDGEALARDYIAEQLKAMGAQPLNGQKQYRVPFDFTAGMHDDGSQLFLLRGDEKQRWADTEQVQALSFSDSKSITGDVVFAGYGLSLPESEDLGYDSYFGLDVEDKIVVVLRYFPEETEGELRAALARHSGLRYKALQARERGAKAIVVVTGPRSPNAGKTVPMTFDTALAGSGIVAASIGGEAAKALFAGHEKGSLEEIQKSFDDGNPHITGFELPGRQLTLDIKVRRERREGYNVVGLLPAAEGRGDEPPLILGAHYDHLGDGSSGNSLADKDDKGGIHHGADDNASGVAAVLEIGRQLAGQKRSRPVILAFWSGEELGLLGSSDFIKNSGMTADEIFAYVNFDMVGRMRDNRLSLQSVGSSSVWPGLIERANVAAGFDLGLQDDPYLPTDSTSFYQAGIPSLNFFTGSHEQYHKPSDQAATLNYEGLERISDFATALASKLIAQADRPDYVTVARQKERSGDRDSVRAFTGTIPDYTAEVEGLRLSGVIEGGPADEGGLQGGDVITEFGGQAIANIYDYTYALDAVKIGKPVKIVFVREGKSMETTITPTSRQ